MSCCFAQGGNTTHPETSTHWPLVSFFFFFNFCLISKPSFSKLKKQKQKTNKTNKNKKNSLFKKKNLKLLQKPDGASPGLTLPPGGLASHKLCCQSPAQCQQGNHPAAGSPYLTLPKSGWPLDSVSITQKEKGEHCQGAKHFPQSRTFLGMCKLSGGEKWEVEK